MAKLYIMLVLALVLVHATARNMPTESTSASINHDQTNTVNVPTATSSPHGKDVKDKKCGVVFAGVGGAAGVGGVAGVIPLGGVGGLGGLGGASGLGGLGGLGGASGLGGVGGAGGAAGGGAGGVGGGVLPLP